MIKLIIECILECENGTYGFNCAKNCTGHCLNDSPCNKQTGICDMGCSAGYQDDYCSKGKFLMKRENAEALIL